MKTHLSMILDGLRYHLFQRGFRTVSPIHPTKRGVIMVLEDTESGKVYTLELAEIRSEISVKGKDLFIQSILDTIQGGTKKRWEDIGL